MLDHGRRAGLGGRSGERHSGDGRFLFVPGLAGFLDSGRPGYGRHRRLAPGTAVAAPVGRAGARCDAIGDGSEHGEAPCCGRCAPIRGGSRIVRRRCRAGWYSGTGAARRQCIDDAAQECASGCVGVVRYRPMGGSGCRAGACFGGTGSSGGIVWRDRVSWSGLSGPGCSNRASRTGSFCATGGARDRGASADGVAQTVCRVVQRSTSLLVTVISRKIQNTSDTPDLRWPRAVFRRMLESPTGE